MGIFGKSDPAEDAAFAHMEIDKQALELKILRDALQHLINKCNVVTCPWRAGFEVSDEKMDEMYGAQIYAEVVTGGLSKECLGPNYKERLEKLKRGF